MVGENPVKRVEKPALAETDPDVRFLETEEVEALLRAVPDDVLGGVERVMYLTAAMTGMRQGELFALRWRDVDWSARRIRVRRNYVRGEFGTPKSKRSARSVPLASRIATELELLFRDSQFKHDDDLVFAHPETGNPIDRSKLLKRFKAALRRADVRAVRFHDLRHTFGTRMAAQGMPMRVLQELMGHRDFKTTLIYADYAPSAREAEWVEEAFRPTTPAIETVAGPPGLIHRPSTQTTEHGRSAARSTPALLRRAHTATAGPPQAGRDGRLHNPNISCQCAETAGGPTLGPGAPEPVSHPGSQHNAR